MRTIENATSASVRMIGDRAALHIADVTKAEEVQRLVDATVKKFGRIDFLVNNAAVRYETAFADMSYDEWRSVLSLSYLLIWPRG